MFVGDTSVPTDVPMINFPLGFGLAGVLVEGIAVGGCEDAEAWVEVLEAIEDCADVLETVEACVDALEVADDWLA